MPLRHSLLLLSTVALLTPIGAMLGLYDTSLEELGRIAAPAIGSLTALGLSTVLSRQARNQKR